MRAYSTLYSIDAVVLAAILFCCLIAFTVLGLRVARMRKVYAATVNEQSVAIASLLALQGLLMAFTFAMAGSRFEDRRASIINETKSIQTAILRADLYDATQRQAFRRDLHLYLEARVQFTLAPYNQRKIEAAIALSNFYAHRLWKRAMRLAPNPQNQIATEQMVEALNSVFELGVARQAANRARVPDPILYMLFTISLATAFFTGYTSVRRPNMDLLVIAAFHLLVTLVIYITIDLDRPRRSLVQANDLNESMEDLRELIRTSEQ